MIALSSGVAELELSLLNEIYFVLSLFLEILCFTAGIMRAAFFSLIHSGLFVKLLIC